MEETTKPDIKKFNGLGIYRPEKVAMNIELNFLVMSPKRSFKASILLYSELTKNMYEGPSFTFHWNIAWFQIF